MLRWILLALCLPAALALAQDAINVDRVITKDIKLAFPNDDNIQPDLSDFAVDNYVLMSNEEGKRWAVVTITNQASGTRTLEQNQLMAILADGKRVLPLPFQERFSGYETVTLTLSFGKRKFPILSVYSRPR